MANTERIELFGSKVILSERRAIDDFTLAKWLEAQSLENGERVAIGYEYALSVLADGLKDNIAPWWKFWRWSRNRKFKKEYLRKYIKSGELDRYCEIIFKLEGKLKKKEQIKAGHQSGAV